MSGIDEPQLSIRQCRARSVPCIDEYLQGKFDEIHNLNITDIEKRAENQLPNDISIVLNKLFISIEGYDADDIGIYK